MSGETALPSPPLNWRVAVAPDCDLAATLAVLPTRPGVFGILDAEDRPLCLATTANLRRRCRAKIEALASSKAASDSSDTAPPAAALLQVRACTAGSRFEVDWAYLQVARALMPLTYSSLLDRWRGWFVHCNPDAKFPQFIKTSTPGSPPTGRDGVYLGPIADKHAAQRMIESLIATFDLCRYQHILLQAPHGRSCAYKEMGRCPAPCDGTVPMARYHEEICAAIACAASPDQWRIDHEAAMARASAARDFEAAARLKRMLDDAAELAKSEFRLLRTLDEFRFVAIMPSESRRHGRIFLIDRGWIAPLIDIPLDAPPSMIESLLKTALDAAHVEWRFDLQTPAVENIGLVCWHMLHPAMPRDPAKRPGDSRRKIAARRQGEFLRFDGEVDPTSIARAMRSLTQGESGLIAESRELSDHSLEFSG